ncbi:enoyl-CoA hydratase/isomerase family protein [Horticoccus luteus]|uniref:Enoyl-CoA hydratase/isomerase family protein n=1 Tax=Horticoccus luteus TaxID=2862869 RepID=A0A8F9XM15_9BACT|nr:3-hydroxyacyl-CoA dehydrogenase NAD-binding domain-containing protein [Horticoccus luteus]QYM79584.1 enoyl-CoA hydratase/isomerase family protein [Horticoccus luteus]
MNSSVTFHVEADDVGWIVIDDPLSRANALSARGRADLAAAIEAARESPARAVVVAGKEQIFGAGAELSELAALASEAEAGAFAQAGAEVMAALAALPKPTVAAIRGACAGGSYEVALACTWRIATDEPATRVGLPELALGTIPGWGGGVRLARLIGASPALEHLWKAQLVPARAALAAGLVDELVPPDEWRTRAREAALRLADKRDAAAEQTNKPGAPTMAAAWRLKARTAAQRAALAVVERAMAPGDEAFALEAERFAGLAASATCKNHIYAFQVRAAARKRTLEGWFPSGVLAEANEAAQRPIRRVGVVGAGVMGSGIAQWLAAHGHAVVLRDVSVDAVAHGTSIVRGLFDEAVKRGKMSASEAAAGWGRVLSTTTWDGFADCDLVIEAIVENIAAKRALFGEIAKIVRGDALLASNTSALPIDEIAGHVPHPERTLGLHFFNPVSRMPLVEMVLAPATSAATAARALTLVKALGKQPVICRSSPGFFVTRVLFFYLNEACRCREEGVAVTALDEALRDFGWPMGPLRLIDEIGVDVTDFIFGEMARYFPERFVASRLCAGMLTRDWWGRKNGAGEGFYTYEGKTERVNAAAEEWVGGGVANVPAERLRERLMRVMVEEARRCLAEGVVRTAEEADFALLAGAGFPAAEGGLLRWAATRE